MGGYLTRSFEPTKNRSLLDQLKSQTINDLLESMTILSQDYAHCNYVNYQQFDDIFCSILDDPSEYFLILQNNHDINCTVDVYETFAVFFILSGDNIETKISSAFKLFDFDHNGVLEMPELYMTLQSATRGLCKIVGIEPPAIGNIEAMAKEIFDIIDVDHNRRISPMEFIIWINNNIELQEFLLKSTGKLTVEYAKKRFITIESELEYIFSLAAEPSYAQYVSEDSLKRALRENAKNYVNPEQIEFLLGIVQSTTNTSFQIIQDGPTISKTAYKTVIKAWSAFSALDYYNTDKLTKNELKTLLWIYEGAEPSEVKLNIEMNEIDNDHSGFISREEWITNFCSPESDGRIVFKKNLRELFEKLDADRSGSLSYEELKVVSAEVFRDYTKTTFDEDKTKYLEEMISYITEDIFRELNVVVDDDKIEWNEFKSYMNVATKKFKTMRSFLDKNFKQE